MPLPELHSYLAPRGAKVAFASACGVTKQTLNDWLRNGRVSPPHAAKASAVSGIPKEKLCPDFDWGTSRRRAKQEA